MPFQFDTYFCFSPLVKFMSCDSLQWSGFFFVTWVFFFVTWVNISSNMLILIVVMETIRAKHKNFQVVLHWHSYMPQQNDNHLWMIIMLQWHIAVSCDHVLTWEHIILVIWINELLRMQRCWSNDALNEEANISAHNYAWDVAINIDHVRLIFCVFFKE